MELYVLHNYQTGEVLVSEKSDFQYTEGDIHEALCVPPYTKDYVTISTIILDALNLRCPSRISDFRKGLMLQFLNLSYSIYCKNGNIERPVYDARPVMLNYCDSAGNGIYGNNNPVMMVTDPFGNVQLSSNVDPLYGPNEMGSFLISEHTIPGNCDVILYDVACDNTKCIDSVKCTVNDGMLIVPATIDMSRSNMTHHNNTSLSSTPIDNIQCTSSSPISITQDGIDAKFNIGPFSINASMKF